MRGLLAALLALCASCTVEATVGTGLRAPSGASPREPSSGRVVCRPSLVDFGTIPPGPQIRRAVDCSIESGATDAITELSVLDGGDAGFEFDLQFDGRSVDPPTAVPPDGRFTIVAEVASHELGPLKASLRLFRSRGEPFDLVARARVDKNSTCAIGADPMILDFGAVTFGRSSDAHVTLSNAGTGTCAVEQLSLLTGSHPDFSIPDDRPLRLPPGGAAPLRLSFRPSSETGPRQALLGVYGDRDVLLRGVPLRGGGYPPSSVTMVQPSSLHFGRRNLACVDASARTFEVRAGEAPVEVNIGLARGSSPSFELDPLEARLAPGERRELPVLFRPDRPGPQRGRVRVQVRGYEPVFVALEADVGEDSLNEETFAGPPPYRLAGTPEYGTAEVWLDGREFPQTWGGSVVWGIDYIRNQLVLADPPRDPDARIEIQYEQTCTPATCGDGQLDPLEACDDGNDDPYDACLPGCRLAFCGDGYLRRDGQEECDDGNTFSGDGCNVVCLVERCGNGVVEGAEECDSGEGRSDELPDACRMDCTLPRCGDGVVDTTEACDDANEVTTDACVSCRRAVCGDGHVFEGVEACDDGNRIDGDGCESDCSLPRFAHQVVGVEEFVPGPIGVPINIDQPLRLPFAFSFLGRPVTQVDASQPGLLVFDGSTPDVVNTSLPDAGTPNGLLAWWWDDLRLRGPAFAWSTGLPGRRVFVLRLEGLTLGASSEAVVEAEIRLFERSGAIAVHYGSAVGTMTAGSASVGWESAEGDRGDDVLGCAPHCALSAWPAHELHVYRP